MVLWLVSACNIAEADQARITIDYAYASRVLAELDVINALVVDAARFAEKRAENQDVRDYARRLRMDHSFINRRVQAIAGGQHVNLDEAVERLHLQLRAVDDSPEAEAEARKQLEELRELRAEIARIDVVHGAAYDARFVEAMERANQIAVFHLSAAKSGVVPPVQNLLSRVVPILSQHVQLAWALQPDPRRATAGT
jgi:predicted outer membrane protein